MNDKDAMQPAINDKDPKYQAEKIDQEVQEVLEKTDEYAAQIDMQQTIQKGKKSAQELQQSDEKD